MCRRQPGIGGSSLIDRVIGINSSEAVLSLALQPSVECVKNATANGMYRTPGPLSTLANLSHCCSPICDSYVRPKSLVRVCDDCSCESLESLAVKRLLTISLP